MARPPFDPTYWGMATHSRRSEEAQVLPPASVPMDENGHYLVSAVAHVASDRPGLVEPGDGRRAVLGAQRDQHPARPVAVAQRQPRAAARAGMGRRSRGQRGDGSPRAGRRDVFCSFAGVGLELVGREPVGAGLGCEHAGTTRSWARIPVNGGE